MKNTPSKINAQETIIMTETNIDTGERPHEDTLDNLNDCDISVKVNN